MKALYATVLSLLLNPLTLLLSLNIFVMYLKRRRAKEVDWDNRGDKNLIRTEKHKTEMGCRKAAEVNCNLVKSERQKGSQGLGV